MENFDVIVVGAGPAGITASIKLAKEGLKVLLVERAASPGEKNMFGGMLPFCPILERIVENFYEIAPIERFVTRRILTIVDGSNLTSFTFESREDNSTLGFTLFRPIFDKWYAERAQKEGVQLLTGYRVTEPIIEGGVCRGVKIENKETIFAPVTLASDGILSFCAKRAGLHKSIPKPEDMALGVKVLFFLGEERIKERFNLSGREGLSMEFLGCTEGIRGGGFLYTQTETLSLGLVLHLDSLKKSGKAPYELLERFLDHPFIRRFLKNGRLIEYSAHLLPEGGIKILPKLYMDGMLVAGDAAFLCYTNGLTQQGMNLAIASGFFAAETILEAYRKGDLSSKGLKTYEERLKESFVLKDMRTFSSVSDLMHNDRLFSLYPKIISEIMKEVFRSDEKPKRKIGRVSLEVMRKYLPFSEILSDFIKIGRSTL